MKLLLQFFGGGSSGAGGTGAGGSKQTTKGAFSTAPGVHGSAGGRGTGAAQGEIPKRQESEYVMTVRPSEMYELYVERHGQVQFVGELNGYDISRLYLYDKNVAAWRREGNRYKVKRKNQK